MKSYLIAVGLILGLLNVSSSSAAIPETISYQGKLILGNTNYQGSAYFKFAILNADATVTYWSNDGSSAGGRIPDRGVELAVVNGLFALGLGDTRIVNMVPIPSSAFANGDAKLRIWFSTSPNSGYTVIDPDQTLRSVPYAHLAGGIVLNSIDEPRLVDGAVTERKLRAGSVSARVIAENSIPGAKLVDNSVPGGKLADGSVSGNKLAPATVDTSRLSDGAISESKIQSGAVSERTLLDNSIPGGKLVQNSVVGGKLTDSSVSGNKLAPATIDSSRLSDGAISESKIQSGAVSARTITDNSIPGTKLADGLNIGEKMINNSIHGNKIVDSSITGPKIAGGTIHSGLLGYLDSISGGTANFGGAVNAGSFNANGLSLGGDSIARAGRLHIQADEHIYLNPFARGTGDNTVWVGGGGGSGNLNVTGRLTANGGLVVGASTFDGRSTELRWTGGTPYIDFSNHESSDFDGRLILVDNATMWFQGVHLHVRATDPSTFADVHARRFVTHAADVAELFDVNGEPQPGFVVSVDPDGEGKLRVSDEEYDETVAGVVSGAGEILSGLILGQEGTAAFGDTPVAVTGRVYTWCDASFGEIKPGDRLVASTTPGHAMKGTDKSRTMGAAVGKALTGLKEGRGLVLVLISVR